jgi:hypothetical protein
MQCAMTEAKPLSRGIQRGITVFFRGHFNTVNFHAPLRSAASLAGRFARGRKRKMAQGLLYGKSLCSRRTDSRRQCGSKRARFQLGGERIVFIETGCARFEVGSLQGLRCYLLDHG